MAQVRVWAERRADVGHPPWRGLYGQPPSSVLVPLLRWTSSPPPPTEIVQSGSRHEAGSFLQVASCGVYSARLQSARGGGGGAQVQTVEVVLDSDRLTGEGLRQAQAVAAQGLMPTALAGGGVNEARELLRWKKLHLP